MSDKGLSTSPAIAQATSGDTGDLMYAVVDGNSRAIHFANFLKNAPSGSFSTLTAGDTGDLIQIYDASAGEWKQIQFGNLLENAPAGAYSALAASDTGDLVAVYDKSAAVWKKVHVANLPTTGLASLTGADTGDLVQVYDASAGAWKKVQFGNLLQNAPTGAFNALTGADTGDLVQVYDASAAVWKKVQFGNLLQNAPTGAFDALTGADTGDLVQVYDASAGAWKKVQFGNLLENAPIASYAALSASDTGDSLPIYDKSATVWKRIQRGNLIGAIFDTRSDASAATISSSVDVIYVGGYTTAGDLGASAYKKAASEPSHAAKFQSADGAWWEIAGPVYRPEHFGAKGDGSTNDATAIQNVCTYVFDAGGGDVTFGPKTYLFSSSITVRRGVRLQGEGFDATVLQKSGAVNIIVGGQSSTTFYVEIHNILFSGDAAAGQSAILLFDRAQQCKVTNCYFTNPGTNGRLVQLATDTDDALGDATTILFNRCRVFLGSTTGAIGFYIFGGGAHTFVDTDVSGTVGSSQTAILFDNDQGYDTLSVRGGLTGDCDWGIFFGGSGNVANVFLNGAYIDRCSRGALSIVPAGTATVSHIVAPGSYFSGVGSTSTSTDEAVVDVNVGSSRALSGLDLTGAFIKDGKTQGVRIRGAGAIEGVSLVGMQIIDCGRLTANTYDAVSVEVAVPGLIVSGNTIWNDITTYRYGINVNSAGDSALVADNNNIRDCATADINGSYLGQLIESQVLQAAAVSLTSGTDANVTSITLTKGVWDVWGSVGTEPASGTTTSLFVGWISQTSATLPANQINSGAYVQSAAAIGATQRTVLPVGRTKISVTSGTATAYLSTRVNFAVSTMKAYGYIGALRIGF